jgi:uncharacterized protein involved in copper resistance
MRMASEFYFASETEALNEDCVAWFDTELRKWIIHHEGADPSGYYEVIFTVEPPN